MVVLIKIHQTKVRRTYHDLLKSELAAEQLKFFLTPLLGESALHLKIH